MRDFLLDTQIIRYWYDSDCSEHAAVLANIESLNEQARPPVEHKPRFLVSVISLGEIEYGLRAQKGDFDEKQESFIRFVGQQLPVRLDLMEDAVTAYGEIRSRLFNHFAPGEKRKPKMRPEQLIDPINSLTLQIQENDLWLCAQAVSHGMVLVTNDGMRAIHEVIKGMKPELLIQNWTHDGEANINDSFVDLN